MHIKKACALCGEPQKRIAPIVHVAGSNGKGSTIAMMRAILQAQGLRVHVLTSPHLVSFRERIVLAGEPITPALWKRCNVLYRRFVPEGLLTYFEHMTLLALMAFERVPADCVLVETGLGGRCDATNIVSPLITVVTPISLDHQEVLGESLTEIAMEKAGIFKKDVPVVVGLQELDVLRILKECAKKQSCPISTYGEDFTLKDHRFLVRHPHRSIASLPNLNLKGAHQWENAATALMTLLQLEIFSELTIGEKAIREGLAHIQWQGRFQRFSEKSYLAGRSGCEHVILDVAHNAQAFELLATLLRHNLLTPLSVVIGLKETKSIVHFLEALKDSIACLVAVPIETGHPPDRLVQEAKKYNIPSYSAPSLHRALDTIKKQASQNTLLIVGSHHVVGRALAMENRARISVKKQAIPLPIF